MHLIVGIDTGKTAAVVCLDLNGSVVHASHAAGEGINWIVSTIRSAGVPDVIATDKPDTGSEIIRKVNAAFNSTLYYPRKNILLREKKIIAKARSIKNPHERDAYVAALKAYNAYSNKLHQVERLGRQRNVDDIDALKSKVIHRYSIDEAVTNRKAHRP